MGGCELLEPRELVSGAPAGPPTQVGERRFQWGGGRDEVVEAVGEFGVGSVDSFGLPPNSPERVRVRDVDAVVIPVGDEGVGQVAVTWQVRDCPYTLWLAPGTTLDEAIAYAPRF